MQKTEFNMDDLLCKYDRDEYKSRITDELMVKTVSSPAQMSIFLEEIHEK